MRQMRVVCGRTVLNLLRNPQTSYAQLALNIFFAILVGLIYYQMPLTLPEALQNRYGQPAAGILIDQFQLSWYENKRSSVFSLFCDNKICFMQDIYNVSRWINKWKIIKLRWSFSCIFLLCSETHCDSYPWKVLHFTLFYTFYFFIQ